MNRAVRVEGGRRWGPAQILALVVGLLYTVLGGVALLRIGGGLQDLFEPTTAVAGLSYTPLLAIIELGVGLMLLALGAFPGGSDGIVFLGLLALAFGLLLVIEPAAFRGSMAAGRAHGWFYVVTGGTAALTALAAPTITSRRTRVEQRRAGRPDEPAPRRRAPDERTRRLDTTDQETSARGR